RHLVLLTWSAHIGISRRIEDPEERDRLTKIVETIRPEGMGAIVRTAAEGRSEAELKADMDYLVRLWETIRKRSESAAAPVLIHRELSLSLRAVRDLFSSESDRIAVDSREEYDRIRSFASQFFPRIQDRIELFGGPEPIFDHYGIEIEVTRALDKKVWLKSGGYIVIEQTEALTVVDVNTGKYVGRSSLEETTAKINLEAVKEIVYQLRLRNIGGIIIIDFIDMKNEENREKVYNALVDALRADRSKTTICKISELGLVEMTRKRVRESLGRSLSDACPYCSGEGVIKSKKTICYDVFRALERQALILSGKQVSLYVHPALAEELFGEERRFLIVDAGMNDLIRPAMYDARHEIVAVEGPGSAGERYDVVGPVCETADRFARDCALPAMKSGDLIAILSAGAYGRVMASAYNARPPAPEVLV
ncbi:MAG: hypothetical protein B7Z74_07475, partial [Deltaproteobacteria bacterium 21-66-5]